MRYFLGPPEDSHPVIEKYQATHQGGYLLELRPYEEDHPIGFIALRPGLKAGVEALVEACARFGVKLEILQAGSPLAAQAVAWRAGIALAPRAPSLVAAIRQRQRSGAVVALVSDSAEAASAFAACDLGVALAGRRDGEFPARADLLAPDLRSLADLLEAGVLRAAAVRDGVGLSILANAAVAPAWSWSGRTGHSALLSACT